MKKIFKLVALSFLMIFIVGCNSNKEIVTKCTLTGDYSSSGYTLNSTYSIYSKSNVVTKVVTEEVVTADNESIRDYFETQLNNSYSAASEAYGGYTYEIKNEDNKVSSNVTIDYEKMNLEKFIEDNASMKNFVNKNNKITLDGVKSIYSTLGAVCE